MSAPRWEDRQAYAAAAIQATVEAVEPGRALRASWKESGEGRVFLCAFGKASMPMARAAVELLGDRLRAGVVLAVPQHAAPIDTRVTVHPADHPLPTERNVAAARSLRDAVRNFASANPGGEVVVLISGGGSAHVTLPVRGVALDDLRRATAQIQSAGIDITGLNAVRALCEQLKAGGLARAAAPCAVSAYVLSDVVGNSLDVIASGPCVDGIRSRYLSAATAVLKRMDIHEFPGAVWNAVMDYTALYSDHDADEARHKKEQHVTHTIIADCETARGGAMGALKALGISVTPSPMIPAIGPPSGVVEPTIRPLRCDTDAACRAVVGCGEPTVDVRGSTGAGGPSQELALALAICLEQLKERSPGVRRSGFCFSTDGIDGPTDAAGAMFDDSTCEQMRLHGVDPAAALRSHDSHGAFEAIGGLIQTGPTGTNVNHVWGVLEFA